MQQAFGCALHLPLPRSAAVDSGAVLADAAVVAGAVEKQFAVPVAGFRALLPEKVMGGAGVAAVAAEVALAVAVVAVAVFEPVLAFAQLRDTYRQYVSIIP